MSGPELRSNTRGPNTLKIDFKIDFKTLKMMQLRSSPGEVLDRVARDGEVFVIERNAEATQCQNVKKTGPCDNASDVKCGYRLDLGNDFRAGLVFFAGRDSQSAGPFEQLVRNPPMVHDRRK